MKHFQRAAVKELTRRLNEPRRFIQVLAGPRQTGKTTLARQVMNATGLPSHYASADDPALRDRSWMEQQWETARLLARKAGEGPGALLILDEIQKIPGWSEVVKRLWDEDTTAELPLRTVVLGSSPLLVHQGLSESLAGRFEVLPVRHWFYPEMREAFGWNVEQHVFFGGYPGAAELVSEPERWRHYVLDSLVETSISRDVLLMTRVDKPALLRRLFELGCVHSGQVLSYQKMVGQLQDAGNTTTLAHYLQLLRGAGLVTGVEKYMGQELRRRATSPKLLVMNTALMSARSGMSLDEARFDSEFWGRLVETAVGAYLANAAVGSDFGLFYWSSRNCEVDFVLSRARKLVTIEVKSGRTRTGLPGIEAFSREHAVHRKLLVGRGGIPLEQFFETPVTHWFE